MRFGTDTLLVVFAAVGRYFLGLLIPVGRVSIFCMKALLHSVTPPYYLLITVKQFFEMWFFSLPIVAVTSIFTGGALVLQDSLVGGIKVAGNFMAGIVTVAIVRELGPVLIGLIVAGRIGAAITAEIGTMRITEQIDALSTLDTDPFHYLIAPRVVALVLAMPVLIIYADVLGVFGGYVVGTLGLNYAKGEYVNGIVSFLQLKDVIEGLVKATAFGLVISLVGCYNGYHCEVGARGVGISTTKTSVSASMLIILLNYVITVFYA
ncbi:MlaE family ABC transporter permease [Candidatus Anaplasma sp. TIGMIC]|uniref:MlaE family ABC transporter permease n=1 Tax=Candidatus Anaplasma sp. TIGMIC TaxID=3020713 RepID=UPI00232B7970|nr:ABC transporter permease [Candidatus Anaplasma sp. TIGMIC]MDB1135499.1 ABC transporter permease [Candidatus Anaplasma sp. TIGMIC]